MSRVSQAPLVLVVEDEEALALLLRYNLEAAGYRCVLIGRGDEAEEHLRDEVPDLLVLDWMLPGLSGLELCRRLRMRPSTGRLPILMLTARGEEAEKVRGLAVGADDYLVKPFSMAELMARIKALLRRADPDRIADRLTAGDLVLDRETMRVTRSGAEAHLGPTEFKLLDCLMHAGGRVLSRADLIDRVWGRDAEIDERTIDVHMGRLRKALGNPDPVRTVRGAGYALETPARAQA